MVTQNVNWVDGRNPGISFFQRISNERIFFPIKNLFISSFFEKPDLWQVDRFIDKPVDPLPLRLSARAGNSYLGRDRSVAIFVEKLEGVFEFGHLLVGQVLHRRHDDVDVVVDDGGSKICRSKLCKKN